jgi:nitroreductase
MDALEALRTRRSVRKYKPTLVPKELVEQIVDCGRLAATARNVQPWEFVAVTDAAKRKRIAGITEFGKFIEHSPVCIVVLCQDTKYYLEDGCAALQNLLVAARALGLGTCWVAGDKKPYAPEIVKLVGAPDSCRLIGLVAMGYSDEKPSPAKRTLKEVLHWETF